MIRIPIIFGLIVISSMTWAATVSKKYYILADSMETVDGSKFPYISFNEVNNFSQQNPLLELDVDDSLSLWVVNFDSVVHEFIIDDLASTYASIPAGDSALIGYKFLSAGAYIYKDPLDGPKNHYLGLGGLIAVKDHNHASFYWNIKEHDSDWNTSLINNGTEDWNTYYPNWFTINGISNPGINLDPTARIVGNVGDTLILYMANNGQSIHSFHLHGYHATILYSSKSALNVGREKDTCPLYPSETLVLQIVPDKEGEYPVHDHNLVAITGNSLYPNGMFTTMLISP